MIRIAIVDDEQYHRKAIRQNIERLDSDVLEPVEICEYESGEDLLKASDLKFHMIFLDQKMEGMSGTEAAECIRKKDKSVLIIFVTALEELWEEGYGVQAFYYLTKPIDDYKFARVYQRAVNKIRDERNPVAFQTMGGIVVFDIYDIIYLAKNQRYTDLYYYDRKTGKVAVEKVKNPLKMIEKQFENFDFVRPHVSYLINPLHITRVIEQNRDKYLVLDNGEQIFISRERLNAVYEVVMKSLSKRTFMVLPEGKRTV